MRLAETTPSAVTEVHGVGMGMGDALDERINEIAEKLTGASENFSLDELPADLLKEIQELSGLDPFERLKRTATLAGSTMATPQDDWGSMVVMINHEGNILPPIPMSKMLEAGMPKELIAKQLLPGLVIASQAERVLMAINSWSLTGTAAEVHDANGSISGHPDREERLVLLDITAEGVQRMSMAQILRDGINPPTLSEWTDAETPEKSEGLFVDALLPALALVIATRERSI
jgi:hypothetical protein